MSEKAPSSIENALAVAVATRKMRRRAKNALKEKRQAEIARVRAERDMANRQHQKEVREKEQRLRLLQTQIDELRKDFHKRLAVHKYAAELTVQDTPNYIVILQAKLCREIHRMCVEDSQLKLLRKADADFAKFAYKQMIDVEQEKDHLEVEVLNSMVKLEMQQRELQEEYNDQVRKQRLEVVDIQKHICHDVEQWKEPGIDAIMDNLSILNSKLKRQQIQPTKSPPPEPTKSPSPEPHDDGEISLDELQTSDHSIDKLLEDEDETKLHSSWDTFQARWSPLDNCDVQKQASHRRSSMLNGTLWRSEKQSIHMS